MQYKNILNIQMAEYNRRYREICRKNPSKSIDTKKAMALRDMCAARGLNVFTMADACAHPFFKEYQYVFEVTAVNMDLDSGIDRFYLKDDSLFDFFRTTEVRPKEVKSILDTLNCEENGMMWGVIGRNYSCLIIYSIIPDEKHIISIFDDDLNRTFCVEECREENEFYNLAMNFLFYIKAFPECVIDGVPEGVKKNPKARKISVSDKIVSGMSSEHGFVRPHFRSGYFRHFNSDYFVNCKGQVRFIASTMVKGKAKTIIDKGE